MKIFNPTQIKAIDAYTIQNEPVASIDLMERAAGEIYSWIIRRFDRSVRFLIFAGPGNNGGDGLALARMLTQREYKADTYCLKFTEKASPEFSINLKRLENTPGASLTFIEHSGQMPFISSEDIVVDAIFGSGLSRPADGLTKEIIRKINNAGSVTIAIDIPSGLFWGDNGNNDREAIVKADFTLSFQFPKLAFLFADNYEFTGEWHILPIGLHPGALRNTVTPYYYIERNDILPIIKERHKFDHKGKFGHALLVSGSYGKTGAAVMGAKAALRTGVGLMTCHLPHCANIVMQCSVPEAMVQTDEAEDYISEIEVIDNFNAIGVGPGIGIHKATQAALKKLLKECKKPMVIDADALNILSQNREWLTLPAPGTILTPHPKEFERLAGESAGGYDRLMKQIEFSNQYKCIVVLKGAYTSVSIPGGNVYFNSTGNPGMAKGGSGDVLTGMILSLLAQGYSPENAALLGVYLHGLAGDIAFEDIPAESIMASDIINSIGKAFKRIRNVN